MAFELLSPKIELPAQVTASGGALRKSVRFYFNARLIRELGWTAVRSFEISIGTGEDFGRLRILPGPGFAAQPNREGRRVEISNTKLRAEVPIELKSVVCPFASPPVQGEVLTVILPWLIPEPLIPPSRRSAA